MKKTMRRISIAFYRAAKDVIHHDAIEHAGYLAFLSLLSFFPFVIFLISVAGSLGESSIGAEFVETLLNNLPSHVADTLRPRINEIISGPPQSLMTLAIIGVIWTASSTVEGIRTTLNRAYRVESPPAYIWRRLLSIVQFILITIVIIIAMSFFIFTPLLLERLPILRDLTATSSLFWNDIRIITIYLTLLAGICLIYYLIPNTKMSFFFILPGAIIVVIGWMASAYVVAEYLAHYRQLSFVYGSLGGIIISLLFFYIINIIFIYGAEFNYHFYKEEKER